MGYTGSIMAANVMVWLSFVPIMVVMLTWITFGAAGLLFIPLVYENAFSVPAWIMGAICTIPGIYSMFIENENRRVASMNVWVILILVFAIVIIGAGIYWVHFIATNNDIMNACLDEVFRVFGKKAKDFGIDMPDDGNAFKRAGDRVATLGKSIAYFEIYKHLNYPYNAVFFLHWQIGVTAVTFCVIPSILALWAMYHAMGIRNYFATKPALFKNQRIIDGPLWDDEAESGSADSDRSFDSEEDEEEDFDPQPTRPLTKRHVEYSAPADVIRVNPAASKVVQGGRSY